MLPLFIILLLGLIDFGHLFFVVNTMTNAAREGARRGAVQPTSALVTSEGELAANRYLALAGLAPGSGSVQANCNLNCPTVTVVGPDANNNVTATVVIPGQFNTITGFSYAVIPNFANPFALLTNVGATSEMRWELAP